MDDDYQGSRHGNHLRTQQDACFLVVRLDGLLRLTPILHRAQQGEETSLVCLYPNCVAEPFDTHDNLNRHYRRAHLSHLSNRRYDTFRCDYENCERSSIPFDRLDALCGHLRTAHKEPIQKKGDARNSTSIADYIDYADWWRCPKCLQRIESNQESNDCSSCESPVGISVIVITTMKADQMYRNICKLGASSRAPRAVHRCHWIVHPRYKRWCI